MKALWDAIDDLRTSYEDAVRNADSPYLAEMNVVRKILWSFPLDDALQMDFSPDQIRQAIAEGVKTPVGLRRIEKNARADEVTETIACARCDVDSPAPSPPPFRRAGDLRRDDGLGWNNLGVCLACQAEKRAEHDKRTKAGTQGRLFG